MKVNEGGANSSSRTKSRLQVTDDSEHSQSDTITYDDPAGRMEREKIMAQLKRGSSPSPDCYTEEDEKDGCDNTTHAVGRHGGVFPNISPSRISIILLCKV